MENIQINGNAINKTAWYDAIKESVAGWLDGTEYSSTVSAIDSSSDISGLVAAYTSVKFSDVYGA